MAIDRPSLALAICMQPDKLVQMAGRPELIDSGFLPRCNIVQPRSLVGDRIETGHEPPLDPQIAATWAKIIRTRMRW